MRHCVCCLSVSLNRGLLIVIVGVVNTALRVYPSNAHVYFLLTYHPYRIVMILLLLLPLAGPSRFGVGSAALLPT